MANIVKKDSVVPENSIAARIQARLRKRFNINVDVVTDADCLLLDCSESMAYDYGGDQLPIDDLRELAAKFANVRRFIFASVCREIKPTDHIPNPFGSTAMHVAFMEIKNRGITHAVMITDGLPDFADQALIAAVGLRIDILYVGPDPTPKFLKELADKTGGKFDDEIKFGGSGGSGDAKKIESKIRGLLSAPK